MRKILFSLLIVVSALSAKAQWVVTDPTNFAGNVINSVKQIVEASTTAKNVISSFKETVKIYEQGKKYYDALKSVNNLVKDAKKVQQIVLMVGEISEIYVVSFGKMMNDPNFHPEELESIAFVYSKLLGESSDMLSEIKSIINPSTLSLSDSERLVFINNTYDKVREHRNLIQYYTQKTISVSYLRSKKKGETQRILSLYGNQDEKYW